NKKEGAGDETHASLSPAENDRAAGRGTAAALSKGYRQNSRRSAIVVVRLPDLEVIWPYVDDVMLADGAPRFGWLKKLYISARNCSRMRSRIGCHRLSTVSKPMVPGLRRFGSVRDPVP